MNVGTTPTFLIHLDGIEFDGSEKIWVYIQSNQLQVPVVVTNEHMDVNGSDLYVFLTEKETSRMTRGKAVLQVRVQEDDGYIWYTAKKLIDVKEVIGSEQLFFR